MIFLLVWFLILKVFFFSLQNEKMDTLHVINQSIDGSNLIDPYIWTQSPASETGTFVQTLPLLVPSIVSVNFNAAVDSMIAR